MIKAFPTAVVGMARLKLVNEAPNLMILKKVLVGLPGDAPKHQALAQQIAIEPAQSKTIDITSTVLKVLGANGSGNIDIGLHFDPQPPSQPETTYWAATAKNQVVEFRLT